MLPPVDFTVVSYITPNALYEPPPPVAPPTLELPSTVPLNTASLSVEELKLPATPPTLLRPFTVPFISMLLADLYPNPINIPTLSYPITFAFLNLTPLITPSATPNNPIFDSDGLFIIKLDIVNAYPLNVPLNGLLLVPIGLNPAPVVSSVCNPSTVPFPFTSPYLVPAAFL